MGLIGHSEWIDRSHGPAENPKLEFIILLAGPGLKGADLLTLQTQAIDRSMVFPKIGDSRNSTQIPNHQSLLSSKDTSTQFENAWTSFLSWKKYTKPEIVSH
jgi:hypothetical protein